MNIIKKKYSYSISDLKMVYKAKFYYPISSLFCVLILISVAPITTYANVDVNNDPEYDFHITVEVDSTTIELKGNSDFMVTPSSYSIYMKEDKGSCAFHLLNYESVPGPGTYTVGINEEVRLAIVCTLKDLEPKERVVSESGTFTIISINSDIFEGHFEMVLNGGISEKKYRISGRVRSENIPSNLKF